MIVQALFKYLGRPFTELMSFFEMSTTGFELHPSDAKAATVHFDPKVTCRYLLHITIC